MLAVGTCNGNDQHDDQDHAGEYQQGQDTRNAGSKCHVAVQLAAFISALAQDAVHGDGRFCSYVVGFHGSGIVFQYAGLVLFDVVDAADSHTVGVDVSGGVIRRQDAQNRIVLGDGVGFLISGGNDGSVLVNGRCCAFTVYRAGSIQIRCAGGNCGGTCLHGVIFHQIDVVTEDLRRIFPGKQNVRGQGHCDHQDQQDCQNDSKDGFGFLFHNATYLFMKSK